MSVFSKKELIKCFYYQSEDRNLNNFMILHDYDYIFNLSHHHEETNQIMLFRLIEVVIRMMKREGKQSPSNLAICRNIMIMAAEIMHICPCPK